MFQEIKDEIFSYDTHSWAERGLNRFFDFPKNRKK